MNLDELTRLAFDENRERGLNAQSSEKFAGQTRGMIKGWLESGRDACLILIGNSFGRACQSPGEAKAQARSMVNSGIKDVRIKRIIL